MRIILNNYTLYIYLETVFPVPAFADKFHFLRFHLLYKLIETIEEIIWTSNM